MGKFSNFLLLPFWKAFTIIGPLHFCKNFRLSLSIST